MLMLMITNIENFYTFLSRIFVRVEAAEDPHDRNLMRVRTLGPSRGIDAYDIVVSRKKACCELGSSRLRSVLSKWLFLGCHK